MGPNPFSLFLILILLILGSDPNTGKKLDFARDFMDRLKTSTTNIQAGIQSILAMEEDFKTKILNMPKTEDS